MSLQSKVAFAKWLQANDPFLFRVVVKAAEIKQRQQNGLGFLGLDWGAIAKTAVDTVKNVAPAVVQYKAQSAALKANIRRAETGQPPINFAEYAPVVRVAPEMTPETEAAINRIAEQSIKKTGGEAAKVMPWIVGGIAAVVLLPKLMKR